MAIDIILRPISRTATRDLCSGNLPSDVQLAPDYPTELSAGIGRSAGPAQPQLGPLFLHRAADDVVVGEIGAALVAPNTAEIGYAVVASCWGRGYATEAVRAFTQRLRGVAGLARIIAHTPIERPASGRVLEKAGFKYTGEHLDEHNGVAITVSRWELRLGAAAVAAAIQRAFVSRDFSLAHDALSADCVFHSPALASPWRSRSIVQRVGAAMTAIMKDVVYDGEPAFGDPTALHLRARHHERAFEAVQLLRVNDDGRLYELTMMIRPLAALLELGQAMHDALPRELLERHAGEQS